MFVREKRVRNRDGSERRYLQLVENYRAEGRVRQRVVANLGRLDRLRGAGELDRLVASLARYGERTKVVDLAQEVRSDWAREWGIPLVCERLLDELGVDEVLRRALAGRRISSPLADAVLALVCDRISEPASKLGCDRWLERAHHARFRALELQHLYRACDLLAELKDELELALWDRRRYRRYLQLAPDALALDRAKIEEDARYDGKWVLRTSTELPADKVALAYKSLWQAERLFRTVKGPLSWRPIYPWTEKRVRGHLVACFLALVCEAELFHRLTAQEGERPSYPKVVSDLKALSAIDLTIGARRYLVRTELRPLAHAAFRAAGLRPPPRVQPLPAPA